MGKTMAEVLAEHPEPEVDGGYWYCPCGHDYGVTFSCDTVAIHQAIALTAAGFGLAADAKREALLHAAEALNMQPPKLKAQYVGALLAYATEPWRLDTCPSECAATHPGREHGASQ